MHCICTAVFQKADLGMNQSDISNSEKIKPVALAAIQLHLSEGIRQTVSQSVENSIEKTVAIYRKHLGSSTFRLGYT